MGVKRLAVTGVLLCCVALGLDPIQATPAPFRFRPDADDNNGIDIGDFSGLVTSFSKTEGQPGYRRGSDFSEDDEIGIVDYSILLFNFGQSGSDPAVWATLVLDGTVTP